MNELYPTISSEAASFYRVYSHRNQLRANNISELVSGLMLLTFRLNHRLPHMTKDANHDLEALEIMLEQYIQPENLDLYESYSLEDKKIHIQKLEDLVIRGLNLFATIISPDKPVSTLSMIIT